MLCLSIIYNKNYCFSKDYKKRKSQGRGKVHKLLRVDMARAGKMPQPSKVFATEPRYFFDPKDLYVEEIIHSHKSSSCMGPGLAFEYSQGSSELSRTPAPGCGMG